jgi:molybdate-binding protein
VLNGRLQNFEFAYGQPQAFDLVLETVQKKGVPQTISVQAVENIARIGGGQSPFMGLTGIFMSLFETFPYRKIGIRASLENDIFTINGTIRENGTEFLVKRGTFSGVNVVNQNPDNRIRFKDMVNRIQRITRGGKPVIE